MNVATAAAHYRLICRFVGSISSSTTLFVSIHVSHTHIYIYYSSAWHTIWMQLCLVLLQNLFCCDFHTWFEHLLNAHLRCFTLGHMKWFGKQIDCFEKNFFVEIEIEIRSRWKSCFIRFPLKVRACNLLLRDGKN